MEKLPDLPKKNISKESIFGTSEASKESIETLEHLNEFLTQGYVLHGSKQKSEILEP